MTELYALVTVGIAAILALTWIWHRRSCRAVHACLTKVAARRGGTIRPATLTTYPQLLFQQGGREVLVSAMPNSGTTITQASAAPEHSFAQVYFEKPTAFTLELLPKSQSNLVEDMLSPRPIATGDPALDALFDLRSNDQTLALALLDGEVRSQLVALAMTQTLQLAFSTVTLFEGGRLVLEEKRPRLSLSLGGIVTDDEAIDQAVTLLLELADRIAPRAVTPGRP